ncbi:hypothetical protein [Cryptosporidium parvum Iowa II]|uniref:Uncharacterized protein n=2 Tax=Cryptosporidium parvum TaxID=5807 RepID=Q5CYJ1_CRYPI|nr:hypothetical protein [Cryptosporidium parvum Iowa II]EAK90244.1 uncharacterized protein [Cryptosporidium parvum Iowa II]QOY40530.1 Uncharacterized protein CPATCC_0007920 [Cryptosporidium parvum]WKS78901.1 hypothetical protein CPCDC_7g2130 [Cryptosporidium sp. 43IA8]WRK33384.1 Uncharacterized protein cpbgf_7002130 [Cryptosporidium parvum]|eukprot:QOY40530.1 hypothetical protein CPATCC_003392 [Cryptosporidium parvum]
MGFSGDKIESSCNIRSQRRLRTDTAEAVFGNFWEAPKNSNFHSRGVKKNKQNYEHEIAENSTQKSDSDSLDKKFNITNLDTQERLSFYESQGAEPYLSKYPTITSILTETQPKRWMIMFSRAQSSSSRDSKDGKNNKKNSKINSSGLTNEDLPFNKMQFIWSSELDEHKRVKLNNKNSPSSQSLLSDPNDLSPIVINFPHPIQLQNISIPYEVLDPRSVPCGSFIWWDRRVWEYNFVYMARRLSTNDEKSRKKLNIENPVTPKKQIRALGESNGQSSKRSRPKVDANPKLNQKSKSPKNVIKQ